MKRFLVPVAVLVLGGIAFAQPPQTRRPRPTPTPALPPFSVQAYREAVAHLNTVRQDHPKIKLFGEIQRRDGDGALSIWGFTTGCRPFAGPGCNGYPPTNVNIVVLDPTAGEIHATYYSGWRNYVGQVTGTNGFGAEVPVYVYGPVPEIQRVIGRVEFLKGLAKLHNVDPETGEAIEVKAVRDQQEREEREKAEAAREKEKEQKFEAARQNGERNVFKGYIQVSSCEGKRSTETSEWKKNPQWEGTVRIDGYEYPFAYWPPLIKNKISKVTNDSDKTPCQSLCERGQCEVHGTYFAANDHFYIETLKD